MKAFKAGTGLQPGLATVLVGNDPASRACAQSKARKIEEAGMVSFEHKLPADVAQEALLALIWCLNDDLQVNGIIVQFPLSKGIDALAVTQAVAPGKDVDGLHALNAGRLALGLPGLVPATPLGVLILLKEQLGSLAGREALVIGRSSLFGKPMAQLLLHETPPSPWRIPGRAIFPPFAGGRRCWWSASGSRRWCGATGSGRVPRSSMSASTA
jgi:methylenetetrahydrofolate dehydrogenase (NADP+)/methenyltetrahydrofolate cyclohydrolase